MKCAPGIGLLESGLTSSVRLSYAPAFADDPKLAENTRRPHRYKTARAAKLGDCGMAGNVAGLDDKERAGMRQRSFVCLCTELVALERLLGGGPLRTAAGTGATRMAKIKARARYLAVIAVTPL